jgi:hypothetical protein
MGGLLLDSARAHRGPELSAAALACAFASLACLGPAVVWFGLAPLR